MTCYERIIVVVSNKTVGIPHHMCRMMEDPKEITEKLLGPSTDLMDRAIMLQYFFNRTAIAEPN